MPTNKSLLDIEIISKKLSEAGIKNYESIVKDIEAQVNKIIKQKIKDAQPYVNEAYENSEGFVSAYSDYDLNKLPSWVVENIDKAKIIGNFKKTFILSDGRKYQLNNTLNHMSVVEWTYFINSEINTSYKISG